VALLAPVIKAAQARRSELRRAFGAAQLAAWRSRLAPYWRPLPSLPSTNGRRHVAARHVHVAVDGTSHAVQLSTGAHFIVAAAAACGPPPVGHRNSADVQVIRGRHDVADAATARDLLMRSLEADVAFGAASVLVGEGLAHDAVVWMDGSLHGELAHVAAPPARLYTDPAEVGDVGPPGWWGAVVSRAVAVLNLRARLLQLAEHSQLWVVGLSKTQRAGFLADALERGMATSPWEPGRHAGARGRAPVDEERPSDGELLALVGAGWSHPLVLDASRFMQRVSDPAYDVLSACPAIVSCYVRPHPADLPLRVDVPASAIGLPDRFLVDDAGTGAHQPAWLPDPDALRPVIEAVLAAYGGMNVYNGPLYAVDRLVRLSRRELETRYLPICAKVAGLPPSALAVDRGRRRFLAPE
jgi:hypothetical protein